MKDVPDKSTQQNFLKVQIKQLNKTVSMTVTFVNAKGICLKLCLMEWCPAGSLRAQYSPCPSQASSWIAPFHSCVWGSVENFHGPPTVFNLYVKDEVKSWELLPNEYQLWDKISLVHNLPNKNKLIYYIYLYMWMYVHICIWVINIHMWERYTYIHTCIY